MEQLAEHICSGLNVQGGQPSGMLDGLDLGLTDNLAKKASVVRFATLCTQDQQAIEISGRPKGAWVMSPEHIVI